MRAMRLLRIGSPLALEEVEVPSPTGTQILVRVEAAGVCHSDVHLRNGAYGNLRLVEELGVRLPLTLGHEIAGTVKQVGDEVAAIREGDRVAVDPWEGDGTCSMCLQGLDHLCLAPTNLGEEVDGGYADYVLVRHPRYLYRISRLAAVDAAPMSCSGLTAYCALRKAGIQARDRMAIVGAGGGLGTMAIQFARIMGAPSIVAFDVDDGALEVCRKLGADVGLNPTRNDWRSSVDSLTDGNGFDVIVDLNCSGATLRTFPPLLARRGRYVLVGLYGGDLATHVPWAIMREAQFLTSTVGAPSDFVNVMSLAERKEIKPQVVRTIPLEEVNTAIDALEKGSVRGRQVVTVA